MSIYSETNKSYYQKNREKLLAKRKNIIKIILKNVYLVEKNII